MALYQHFIARGGGQGQRENRTALIVLERVGKTDEAVTTVVDPNCLSAEDVIKLYPLRWKIERLFFDLKDVLSSRGSTLRIRTRIAMQVYLAAMVHAAFRSLRRTPPSRSLPKISFLTLPSSRSSCWKPSGTSKRHAR